jgi:hypothetical protein
MTIDEKSIERLAVALDKANEKTERLNENLKLTADIANNVIGQLSSEIQDAILRGEALEITLEDIYLRVAQLALDQAFNPLEQAVGKAIDGLLSVDPAASRNQQRS